MREKLLIAVRNAHTAMVAKIAPGQVGEVDANNPGVRVALDAGLLQPVRDDGLTLPSTDGGTVPASEMRAAVAEIDRLNALCASQVIELGELRAQVEALTAPSDPAEPEADGKPAKGGKKN